MSERAQRIETLDDLRTYINTTLCEREQLEVGAFRMTEMILLRGQRSCGLHFCLHGPRQTKFSAIWETDNNTILFYDSSGQRFARTRLAPAPALEPAAA